jgi:membrane-associated phospholipid phosphatase
LLVAAALALSSATTASADVVTEWNAAALHTIRTARISPPQASRALAILHLSIFDAVNGIDRTYEQYLLPSGVPASASKDAAASAAAHRVLAALFTDQADLFDALHAQGLATVPDGPQKARGAAWGAYVADQMLTARLNDNWDAVVPPPAGGGAGVWFPTPPLFAAYLLPHWGMVAPFAMPTGAHFRPLGPPALDSAAYADAYNEVKAYGSLASTIRTTDQTQIALFWADGAGTETPPGHWNSIARDVAAVRDNTMEQNARLFALLNAAMADAGICAWDAKYRFNNWRPVTAIRLGETDGNPATAGDPSWSSLIGTPPFPDYVSGHSTFSAAAARVLARFYGTDRIAFATGSDGLPGVTRSFASFSAAAGEAAMSRVYGGIHFRFASDDGMAAGLEIGEWAFTRILQPKGDRSRK